MIPSSLRRVAQAPNAVEQFLTGDLPMNPMDRVAVVGDFSSTALRCERLPGPTGMYNREIALHVATDTTHANAVALKDLTAASVDAMLEGLRRELPSGQQAQITVRVPRAGALNKDALSGALVAGLRQAGTFELVPPRNPAANQDFDLYEAVVTGS